MSPTPRHGPVKGHLEQLIGRHSRESGVATDRVRRWVSTMAMLGALERAAPDHASPLFLLKGGVAIELRVRTGARATKDVDVVFSAEPGELLDTLDAAFAEPYCDFAFRRGAPAEHGPHATRFDVRLTYQTRAWATVRLEISGPEQGADEPEYVKAISLQDFKLTGPQAIACLPLRFQIAQKLHAVSERPTGRTNDRFRDLVDLLVLRNLIDDLPGLRRAGETTFASRATHAWPPRSTRRRPGRPVALRRRRGAPPARSLADHTAVLDERDRRAADGRRGRRVAPNPALNGQRLRPGLVAGSTAAPCRRPLSPRARRARVRAVRRVPARSVRR